MKSESIIQINDQKFRIDVLNDDQGIIYEIQRASFGGRFSKKIQTLLDSTKYVIRINSGQCLRGLYLGAIFLFF